MGGVVLGVPLYKNPDLVAAVARSIESSEISSCRDVHCLFVIDSPDDTNLIEEAQLWRHRLSKRFPTTIVVNRTNVGFVQSANTIFNYALNLGFDVILINSDAILQPDTIEEMVAVAESDPMIGFVSPRTNNTSICTFPLPASNDAEAAYRQFIALRKLLPRKTYVPVVVGFCLYCKSIVIKELGLFDPIYGMGYNEENDLMMRANRVGYSCAIANWAYAFHTGHVSFDLLDGTNAGWRDLDNAKILSERYPEYLRALDDYFNSPEYRAFQLLSTIRPDDSRPSLAFDLSSFGEHYNGTFELAYQVVRSFCNAYSDRYDIHAICSKPVWQFHALGDIRGLHHSPIESSSLFTYVVRLAQPFTTQSLTIPFTRGAVVLVGMLDPIAYDCHYIRAKQLGRWWQFVFDQSDVILYISEFCARGFRERFQISRMARQLVAMPSLSADEYARENQDDSNVQPYLLVVGNWYFHKHIKETVRLLRSHCPTLALKVLGTKIDEMDGESYESGSVTPAIVERLFSESRAIVLPTFYEGFGFPLMHALARKKPVFARKIPVFEEIYGHLQTANIHFYETSDQLVTQLAGGVPEWRDEETVKDVRSWHETASDIESALKGKLAEVDFERLVRRLRELDAVVTCDQDAQTKQKEVQATLQEVQATLNSRSKLFRHLLKLLRQKWTHRAIS